MLSWLMGYDETCGGIGDKMSLLDEYVKNKVERAENRMIRNQLISGLEAEFIARTSKVPLSRVRDIEKSLKSRK